MIDIDREIARRRRRSSIRQPARANLLPARMVTPSGGVTPKGLGVEWSTYQTSMLGVTRRKNWRWVLAGSGSDSCGAWSVSQTRVPALRAKPPGRRGRRSSRSPWSPRGASSVGRQLKTRQEWSTVLAMKRPPSKWPERLGPLRKTPRPQARVMGRKVAESSAAKVAPGDKPRVGASQWSPGRRWLRPGSTSDSSTVRYPTLFQWRRAMGHAVRSGM
mmetsp:Transcript_7564/g.19710  ORF Transcript_7564/g.19710 Transcript_7564/m.19710 type:complete len:217 (-) Transcript_7564:585-1235(-)